MAGGQLRGQLHRSLREQVEQLQPQVGTERLGQALGDLHGPFVAELAEVLEVLLEAVEHDGQIHDDVTMTSNSTSVKHQLRCGNAAALTPGSGRLAAPKTPETLMRRGGPRCTRLRAGAQGIDHSAHRDRAGRRCDLHRRRAGDPVAPGRGRRGGRPDRLRLLVRDRHLHRASSRSSRRSSSTRSSTSGPSPTTTPTARRSTATRDRDRLDGHPGRPRHRDLDRQRDRARPERPCRHEPARSSRSTRGSSPGSSSTRTARATAT